MVISTTRIAPVGSVLPSSASADIVGQPVRHDAGADDGRDQQRGAERLRGEAARQVDRHGAQPAFGRLPPISSQPLLQRELVDRVHRQAGEDRDAIVQHAIGLGEGEMLLRLGAFDRGRVGHAPMRRHRLARPDRAGFAGGVVADREDEVHLGRAGRGELVPVLRAGEGRVVVEALQQLERIGMDLALGMRAGRERLEPAGADAVEDRLGDDRARRIAGAQEQDVEDLIAHGWLLPSSCTSRPR